MERGFFVKPTPFGEVELGDLAGAPAPLQDLPLHPAMTVEELKLTLRIREVEVRNRELEVEAMLLKVKALEIERGAAVPASPASLSPSSGREDGFDVSRHIALVPPFRESEVDSYFNAFERIAATLKWPKTVWPLLLQCKFVGKAQEVCTSLSIEDSLDYDKVKATVLRAYELVPEAYRQSHDIDVGGHKPIKQHAYRVHPTKRTVMQQEVKYLLDHGFAVPSNSPWSSPSLLVPKPDQTPRFCNDYRKVNAITKPDSFPLPRMDDCVDRVGSAKYVTKLDLLKGYWQVPLTPRASEISAFVTPDHFLQYTVMPFGLRNAPATFQRLMNTVLSGVNTCEVYLDDIVAYSATWSEHLKTLSEIFSRLRAASLTLNLAKCEFGKAVVTYLGKQVGQGQVCPVAAKVQAILDFPAPQTRHELRRFLGMAEYYRAFCKNFSDVPAPLTSLVSPKTPYQWSEKCQSAFQAAKALLCSAPVLAAPNFTHPFKLEVDASALGAGAVLLQEDDAGIDHPICYFSKKFKKHQLHYSTIEKEALALLLALQHFEVYLGSSSIPTVVYSDHNPLVFLTRMRNNNSRLMRWSLLLQDFNIVIHYKRGPDNILADALSRC
ncbi:hypothetical protein Q8A73_015217 [Channa argus]|nr:hypothetical protein Q8A73_015217 [Channa argus]